MPKHVLKIVVFVLKYLNWILCTKGNHSWVLINTLNWHVDWYYLYLIDISVDTRKLVESQVIFDQCRYVVWHLADYWTTVDKCQSKVDQVHVLMGMSIKYWLMVSINQHSTTDSSSAHDPQNYSLFCSPMYQWKRNIKSYTLGMEVAIWSHWLLRGSGFYTMNGIKGIFLLAIVKLEFRRKHCSSQHYVSKKNSTAFYCARQCK